MADIDAILSGEAQFPVIGATAEDCQGMFEHYAQRCERARIILDRLVDAEDFDEERERQQTLQELLPAMNAMVSMLLSQDSKLMIQLFADKFMYDTDCLRFLEVMRDTYPQVNAFVGRVEKAMAT